jgi:predicted alpha/beta-hydrolase family hydrolase
MLAAREPEIAEALLLLSYPLHPPEKPANLRTEHFPSLRVPALFVSGERDGFGTREELQSALALIPASAELIMVSGVGHELMAKKNSNDLPDLVVRSFLDFVSGQRGLKNSP